MTDPNHELDELLRHAARDYNRPGETPRDRMWEAIRADRARRVSVARPARWRPFVLPAVAAALLVMGIMIGGLYERMTALRTPLSHVTSGTTPLDTGTSLLHDRRQLPQSIAGPPEGSREVVRDSHPASGTRPSSHALRRAPQSTTDLAFQLAVVQHLAGTEAMLTSFRAEAARGDVDAQLTSWARNLLTTTRLLEAAAPQQDPTMERLLGDLELVLIQIAQYSPTNPHRAEELELIEHSITRRGVIDKLRTTLPARLVPSGT